MKYCRLSCIWGCPDPLSEYVDPVLAALQFWLHALLRCLEAAFSVQALWFLYQSRRHRVPGWPRGCPTTSCFSHSESQVSGGTHFSSLLLALQYYLAFQINKTWNTFNYILKLFQTEMVKDFKNSFDDVYIVNQER